MADMIQVRRDTAALWNTTNPILASGEFGYESDTGKLKIGDGTTTWTSLDYFTLLVDGITSTAAELNILDGVTATAAELNKLDGVTVSTSELNSVTSKAPIASPTFTGTATAPTVNASTALQIGGTAVTSTAAELNILDGVTASTAELNKLDALSRGSILYGNASGATTVLTKGTAEQVLTSDGTDISWADAGGSGSVDLVASGAISSGEAVQVNTDGTVSAPALSAVSSPTVADHLESTTGSGPHCCCYDHVNNQIYVFHYENSQWYCAVATPNSANELSFVSTVMTGITAQHSEWCSCVYVPSADKVIFAYNKNNYGLKMHTVKASSSNVCSIGAEDSNSLGTFNEFQQLVYDPGSGKAILYYNKYSQSTISAILLSVSGTTITSGNAVFVTDWNPDYGWGVYDASVEKHLFISSRSSTNDLDAVVVTVSGNSISVGSTVVIATDGYKASCWYDANIERTIVVYLKSGATMVRILSISGTTPSVTSATELSNVSNANRSLGFYDSMTTKNYVRVDDDVYEVSASTSGASITGSALYDVDEFNGGRMSHNQDIYAGDIGLHFWNHAGGKSHSASLTSTTLDTDNVLGVVTSAYTNGQTATVSIVGSSATVSGVAAAKTYYAQRNGTLGTFNSGAPIGLGIGTNTLLVKG